MNKKLLLVSVLVLVVTRVIRWLMMQSRLETNHENYNKRREDGRYDFIIVGSGTAGSVLANRLSTDPNHTVLLLEAGGPDDDIRIKVPSAFYQNFGTSNDWNYDSVPQKHNQNKTIYHPRGKTLGGSSSINAMIYLRGSAYDYDQWATKYNLDGWNWTQALHYFKKTEHQEQDHLDSEFHNKEGNWHIDNVYRHWLSEQLVEGVQQVLGLPWVEDFNAHHYSAPGIGFNQVNVKQGTRHSLSDAMLNDTVLARQNLYIWTHAHVTRIVFNGTVATGVEVRLSTEEVVIVTANKEVLLSAGAYNSPQLLQLSGIGPRHMLEQHSIPVLVDNPQVGANLQDHVLVGLVEYRNTSNATLDQYKKGFTFFKGLLDWSFNKQHSSLSTNIGEINGILSSEECPPNKTSIDYNNGFEYSNNCRQNNITGYDLQLVAGPCMFVDHGRKDMPYPGGFTLSVVLVQPESSGWVGLQSSDPLAAPLIDPNIFSHPADYPRLKNGLQQLLKVRNSPYIRALSVGNALLDDPVHLTDEQLDQYIADNAFLLYHGSCTCAMGKVLDNALRVKGVQRLRVVDASAMPVIPRVNTNAPTAMLAEKAADLIWNQYH